MIQPSLAFLTLPIPAAMDLLGSLRTLEHFPERTGYGVSDMIEGLMNCFPDAAAEYYRLMNTSALVAWKTPGAHQDFNHVAVAHRLLAPAVAKATFPLETEYGTMSADTPLTLALTPKQALNLLEECLGHDEHLDWEPDADALFDMTWKLTHTYPSIAAELDIVLNEDGTDYYPEAFRLLKEAAAADKDQFGMAA